jgi:hypothetical protein
MTVDELKDLFEQHSHEGRLDFHRISVKRSSSPDLHAFLLISELLPSDNNIISTAEHDRIWLEVEVEDLAEVATEEIVLELVRCGVIYDDGVGLAMDK